MLTEIPKAGLVVDKIRSWDFRPYGQSRAVRKHRIVRRCLKLYEWKVACGIISRRAAKKAAIRYAEIVVAGSATAGAKCAVRMGNQTWLAVL